MGNKTKNTLISVGVSLAPVAASMIANGKLVSGGFLVIVCGALTFGYTYLDDKSKSDVTLPDGVDEDTFVDLAERLSELEFERLQRRRSDSTSSTKMSEDEHNVSEQLTDLVDNNTQSEGE